ncbi:protein GRAVITROPIC IN THE LIGHT 1-like [Zingiber officinale]|nr:protein GRAVITROPIC IN THE LIGHT 1-like [Zingiber officinale]
MEPAKAAPLPNFGSVARTVTKILRLRRSAASSAEGATVAVAGSLDAIGKLKLCRDFGDYSGILFESSGDDVLKPENEKKQQKKDSSRDQEALESFVANLFASISAFKAAYAQLQVAQSSYDLDLIQSTDATIVAELRRMSELKRSYFRNQSDGITNSVLQPALAAQLQEFRNLTKTYKVTTRKLEDEIELKESEIDALRAELLESERKGRVFEAKLHPNRSLAALDALHLSGVNPTHFLTVLRYTFKAIRSFVQLMEKEMESAGWNLDAAAGSIQADVLNRGKPGHRTFAFESYVCRRMFSDFSQQNFGLSVLGECSTWDRRKFFNEFTQVKSLSMNHILDGPRPSQLAQFCRAKYLSLVRPKMESAFFGDQKKRAAVSSGKDSPDSEFIAGFAEMARRMWLLHCLFFSFEAEIERSIFQIRRGSRFSEVYMESVTAAEDKDCAGEAATVGFTVVPGFRVDRTLIQCKVYLISEPHRRS